jgi:hypothetical protein
VVLLIDDPPDPQALEAQASLEAARAMPGEVERLLRGAGGSRPA